MLAPLLHFGMPLFGIGELKLMLSDWLTVLHAHMQSRFHVFLMICKRGVGYLPFNFCCLELRMCQTFPTLPLPGSIELRPCDKCFGPEWIAGMAPFPFTDLLSSNILRQFWAQSTFRPFLPEGINRELYARQTGCHPPRL